MVLNKVEVKTDNVNLLIVILEILKNKDYLGQIVLGPKESLDLILGLKEKKLLRLTISERLNNYSTDDDDRDLRVISISDENRSSVNSNEGFVSTYDYGQQFVSSIKSIKEAVENKLTEIKKNIENSMMK